MALTGLDIYKKLPRTNCKECGFPTCLAFAMKVAAGQMELAKCTQLTADATQALSEASAPPQRLVKIGPDAKCVQVGQETVLFRHDARFVNPTALALTVNASAGAAGVSKACAALKKLAFPRVGQVLTPDLLAVVHDSGTAEAFVAAVKVAVAEAGVPLVLMSGDLSALEAAATGPAAGTRPLLYVAADASVDQLVALAQTTAAPLCIAGPIDAVADKTAALAEKGVKDLVISPGVVGAGQAINFLTQTRRAALGKKFRPLGYPVLALAGGDDPMAAALDACAYVCKYAGIVVADVWEAPLVLAILTTRQNIYTDPQKPVQVEAKLYQLGETTDKSPLLVTTNFSLSYYSVEGEAESAHVPCYILAVNTDGTSVLTAWAADKFNPANITKAIKDSGVAEKLSHKKVIIPGHVAVISSLLAEECGWEVLVGPKEASGIGPYLKNEWKA